MDSSESGGGSMQSSSGGEDQQSPANFLLNQTNNHSTNSLLVGPILDPPPPQTHHHLASSFSSSPSLMFDTLPSYLDPSSNSNYNSLLNLYMASWSSKSTQYPSGDGFIFSPDQSQNPSTTTGTTSYPPPPPPPPPLPLQASNVSEPNNNKNSHHSMGVRIPKKRSRASRRAPTTVLTTDTSNFRAMVQEFTGIPAPPFTSSPFPRGGARFEIFGTALRSPSSSMDNASQMLAPPPPPYLLRPFPQKIQPTSSPSSAINLLLNSNQQQQQQNPVANFQSLLSSSLQFPVSDNISSSSLPDFGLGHGGSIQDLVPPLSSTQETTGLMYNASQQRDSYTNGGGGDRGHPQPDHHHHHHHAGLEARTSEGIMESWICSSD